MHPSFVLAFCLSLLFSCSGSPPPATNNLSPLDFADIAGNDGWRLRINGDGSATLTHRQHPLHHLDYPRATFQLQPGFKLAKACKSPSTLDLCTQIIYYRATTDREYACDCANNDWLKRTMVMAITNMQLAVDDSENNRACRMLRRQWLAAN